MRMRALELNYIHRCTFDKRNRLKKIFSLPELEISPEEFQIHADVYQNLYYMDQMATDLYTADRLYGDVEALIVFILLSSSFGSWVLIIL